ncbi:MAG TPA: acyl-CoA dehydrogenase family protein, partial [Myxococcota bacterium]|nr:acyl-CoA dehydrogenase family protein [Myxococcota bacterium]
MFHLRKLTLQNFRCFAHAELALEDDITVLFAENGGGKTSILWAISILLAGWLYHPPQTLSLKWRRDVRQERSERGQWQPKGGCTIRGDWELGGQTIQSSRTVEETRDRMVAGKSPTKQMVVDWQRKLNARGWAVPEWPVEHGGPGWSAAQRYIFREELQQAPAPQPLAFNVNMCGPVIIGFGTEEQKKRFLPRMAADTLSAFCLSEPNVGCDAGGQETRCELSPCGSFYILNGEKKWATSGALSGLFTVMAKQKFTDPK